MADETETVAAVKTRQEQAQELLQERRLAKAGIEAAQKQRAVVWEQPNSPDKDAELAELDTRIQELTAQVSDVDQRLAALIPGQRFGKFERVRFSNFN